MSIRRTLARACALPAAAGLVLLGAAGPSSAHVTITPDTAVAGEYAVLTVSVPHGCDGSPTTQVEVKLPEEITSVTPTRNPLWDQQVDIQKLDQPVTDEHGNTVSERVGSVVYTAKTPLPDGVRDTFELSVQIPDTPGETLVFPTIQTCEKGRTAWTQVAEGGDSDELEHPAPAFEVEQAAADDASTGQQDAAGSTAEDDSDTLGYVGAGAGLLGLLAGGTALVLARRKE